ncbi:DNA-directed RNA polymerase subunit delta [Oceanispirochaeta crateris]|uniref:DNA-directed RNA polymerase subunit delta n=1 Tax=Oceanispirochaeta crateris TaxID=2518645 RepID=A0A5C1QKD6_9SPIO|nr:S-adenosyl-l-methionine hydroxide adenosyltransferase family protein [Oceanispirochaeta crateris]QEN06602.1 DNA-directed RNA polymerase subunit delta [Oceanispirochaeta crateris]
MNKILVFQSDFGLVDGAVSAMHGVANMVDDSLKIYDLTHDIPQYSIWEASYRLYQTTEYWPKGTVFVSVVDPGVGSKRLSVVAETIDGHFIVTPDNGTLTHMKKYVGLKEVREIDETKHRREDTEYSYTFHGRDVYANTGAKLASGTISFEQVGKIVDLEKITELAVGDVIRTETSVLGSIDILDVRFGSLWTNIPRDEFVKTGFKHGETVEVMIRNNKVMAYNNRIVYGRSFADVYPSEQVIYVNSVYNMAIAINQGNFAKAYNIGTGHHWEIEFKKMK